MPIKITSEPPASWVLIVQEYFSYHTLNGSIFCSSPTATDTRPVFTTKKVTTQSRRATSDSGEVTSPTRPPLSSYTCPPSQADNTKLHRLNRPLWVCRRGRPTIQK